MKMAKCVRALLRFVPALLPALTVVTTILAVYLACREVFKPIDSGTSWSFAEMAAEVDHADNCESCQTGRLREAFRFVGLEGDGRFRPYGRPSGFEPVIRRRRRSPRFD